MKRRKVLFILHTAAAIFINNLVLIREIDSFISKKISARVDSESILGRGEKLSHSNILITFIFLLFFLLRKLILFSVSLLLLDKKRTLASLSISALGQMTSREEKINSFFQENENHIYEEITEKLTWLSH